jgi:N-acyl homoserine lactone hydrolase
MPSADERSSLATRARLPRRPRLHVLDLGALELDKSTIVGHATIATDMCRDQPAEWTSVPSFSVLIEHPQGRVLFDTGCNPQWRERWPEEVQATDVWNATEECHLPNRLEQLGLRPGDVDLVVASHLHSDHAGCLEFFTESEVMVHRDELRGALEHYATPGYAGGYIKDDITAWIENGIRWRIIDPHEPHVPIYDGLTLLNLGAGHVEGMLGLDVSLPEAGRLLLVSDACYGHANWGPPPVLPGIGSVFDSVGMFRTMTRLRNLAAATGADVWFGHDPDQFASLRKGPDSYYE